MPLPSGRLYLTMQEDMIDLIAWRYYGASSGALERILDINAHDEAHALSSQAEVLEPAKLVLLPRIARTDLKFFRTWRDSIMDVA